MASNFTHAIVRAPSKSLINGLTTSGYLGTPDYELALQQHADYVKALKQAGLEVTVLPAIEKFPDSVFVEDTCVITPKGVVVDRPGTDERRGEPEAMLPTLKQFFDDERIAYIEAPGTLEGGDVMMVDDTYYVAKSARTNDEGFRQFADHLAGWGLKAVQVPLHEILHLKTGSTYMEDGNLLVGGELQTAPEYQDKGFHMYNVPDDEAYAADAVRINDKVLMSAGYPHVRAQLDKWGYDVIELEMSEFHKIDGSITCLSLRW